MLNLSQEANCSGGSTHDEMEFYDDFSFWTEAVLQPSVAAFGLVANAVAIPILVSPRLTNLFNLTLALLAIFDNIYLVCEVLESIRQIFGPIGPVHIYLFPQVRFDICHSDPIGPIFLHLL